MASKIHPMNLLMHPAALGQLTNPTLHTLGGSRGSRSSTNRKKKRAPAAKKKSSTRRKSSAKAGPARLVKGSAAAKAHMSKIRKLRKKK
jgi:hypothetical protein